MEQGYIGTGYAVKDSIYNQATLNKIACERMTKYVKNRLEQAVSEAFKR